MDPIIVVATPVLFRFLIWLSKLISITKIAMAHGHDDEGGDEYGLEKMQKNLVLLDEKKRERNR